MKNSIMTMVIILLTTSMINAQTMGRGFNGGIPSVSNAVSANNESNMSADLSLTNTSDIYLITLTQFLDSTTTIDEKSSKQLKKLVERENEYNNNIVSTLSGGTSSLMNPNIESIQMMGSFEGGFESGFEGGSVVADKTEIERLLTRNESQFDKKYQKLLSQEQFTYWKDMITSCRKTFRENALNNNSHNRTTERGIFS